MRWFNFFILVFVALILQVGVTRVLGLGPQKVMPDLMLLLAVILAFRGQGYSIMIACWILGLLRDLTSAAPLGGYALGFGLAALLIARLREWLYADRPLTMILLTFLSAFLVEQWVFLLSLIRGEIAGEHFGNITVSTIFSALFTAALAPYAQWLVIKLHRLLGLPRHRIYTR